MIVNYWPQWFRNLYGGEWPRNYCTFDIETTGYKMDLDVITELAHCLVQDGKIVDELSVIVDWTNHSVVPDHWLRRRLQEVTQSMALAGQTYHITYEKMQAEGMKPDKALGFYRDLFTTLMRRDMVFVAHGGYSFDEKMIAANFGGFGIAQNFGFGDNNLMDTDGIEKASQALSNPRCLPRQGDTLRSYFHRVKYTRLPGIKSNLSTHCFEKYDFASKHGLTKKDMHGAGVDSRSVHYLMEEYRPLIQLPAAQLDEAPQYQLAPKRNQQSAETGSATRMRNRKRGQRNN